MRKKATYKKAALTAVNTFPAKSSAEFKVTTQTTTPAGKGLGKAGARRLGQLLKRATQDQEAQGEEKASLPKTPVRLFKHRIQIAAGNSSRTHTAKPHLPHIHRLILDAVSQCKLQGGICMAELRQLLAAGGFDVTHNNCLVTPRLLKKETALQTTRISSFRLNNMKQIHTKQVRMSNVQTPNSKTNLRQRARMSRGAETSQRQAKRTLRKATQKLTLKTSKAAAKSHKPRRMRPQPKGKPPRPAGKKSRSTNKQPGFKK
ncbi:histone H1.1-like [Pungitius pungitius]|uniref:histone H1.1-like n=1 Tax=Pungitius pungitius TaxID=134920 RepID=UPI002E0F64F8